MMIQPRYPSTRRKDDRRNGVFRAAIVLAVGVCLAGGFVPPAQADVRHPRSLFVMDRDGTNLRHVVHVEGYSSMGSPRWSHDGRRLVFDVRNVDSAKNRCFVVNSDGTGLLDVGPGAFSDWSPDDKQLAFAAGANKSLAKGIWVQNTNGRGRQYLSLGVAPRWSPDGSKLAFYAAGLKILDLVEGSTRSVFAPHEKVRRIQNGFDWSPDGTQLAVVVKRDDKTRAVVIVDAAGSSEGMRVRSQAQVNDVAWSPDGKTLALSIFDPALGDHRIHLLSVDGDDAAVEILGQQGDNREVAWSPNGTQLAFTTSRRDIPWQRTGAPTGGVALEKVAAYDSGGTCYSLALAPDGRTALLGANLGSRRVQVWDLETREVLNSFNMLGVLVAIAPNGKEAACSELYKMSVTYFNLEDGSPIREFDVGAMVIFLNISGDGSRLVCGSRKGVALVFDVKTGVEVSRLEHGAPVGRGALSPDGRIVATAAGKKLYLWDATSGKKLKQMEHPAQVWDVAFSPDGSRVVTGTGGTPIGQLSEQRVPVSDDNSLRLWDVAQGKLVGEMKGHEHAITAVAFSPDGRLIASGSADGTLRLWDADSGAELSRDSGRSWIFDIVFSYDGSLVLTSGGNFRESPDAPRITDVPGERVRVFRVVTPGGQAHAASEQVNEP